jgi:HEAT repeat protein
MPDYNFQCAECGTQLDLIVHPDPGEVIPCPTCGEPFMAKASRNPLTKLVAFSILAGFFGLAIVAAIVVYFWAKQDKDPSVDSGTSPLVKARSVATQPAAQAEPSVPELLGYKWGLGQKSAYKIALEVNGRSFHGVNTYQVVTIDGRTKLAFLGRRQFNRTGFVVSDRYIVTSARNLRWASRVELWVKDRFHAAKIFAIDKSIDLAVLRLDAPDLPTFNLASISELETGDDVWLVNCETGNSLLKSVKQVKGKITEVDKSETHTKIVIDHSGNRVVEDAAVLNKLGQLIGVVGGRTTTDPKSRVRAIAVTSVRGLLEQHRIEVAENNHAEDSKSKSILARSRPALVRLQVTVDPSAATLSHRYTLRTKSNFVPFDNPDENLVKKSVSALMNVLNRQQGNLVMDELGNLLEKKRTTPMPFALGSAEQLPFIPFSASGKRTWEKYELLPVRISSLSQQTNEQVHAVREIYYEIEDVSGGKVTIGIDLSVKSLGWEVAATGIKLEGTGRAVFDFENGRIESNQLSLFYQQKVDSKLTRFPVELTSTLIEDQAVARVVPKVNTNPEKYSESEERAAKLDELLFRLSQTDEPAECAEVISEILKLKGLPEYQEQVKRKASSLLRHQDAKIRNVGIRAIGLCGDPNYALIIRQYLGYEDSVLDTVQALIAMDHEKADKALVSALTSRRQGFRRENKRMVRVVIEHPAADVFRAIGKPAEPLLLRLLDTAKDAEKPSILSLLGEIGGKDTVAHLKSLLFEGVENDRTRMSIELLLNKLDDQRQLPKNPSSLIVALKVAKSQKDISSVLESLLELNVESHKDQRELVSTEVRRLLYRRDDEIALKALSVLQKWKHNDDFVTSLIPFTRRTDNLELQQEALRMLCMDRTPAATRNLIVSLHHADAYVTEAVVDGLKKIGNASEFGLLLLIQYHDERTVAKVCEILAVSGGIRTVRQIEEILGSGVFDSRTLASFQEVLKSLSPQSRFLSLTKPDLELLSPKDAVEALDLSKPLTAQLSALMSLAAAPPTDPPRSEVATRLNRFMNHKHPTIRAWTFRVLHTWSVEDNIPAIQEMLESDDDFVRWTTIDAIPYVFHDKTNAARAIARSMASGHVDSWWSNRAIMTIGRPAEHAIMELLSDASPAVAYSAIQLLAKIGGPDSVARLKQLAENHPQLKVGAASALKRLEERLQTESEQGSTDD